MLTGEMFIGASRIAGAHGSAVSYDPRTGDALTPTYGHAGTDEVEAATELAKEAFDTFRELTPEARARFLDRIADNIEALGDELVARASAESGLPLPRILSERGRTIGQLRLFASVLREGGWLGARIDPARPERAPLPRVDIRQRQIPLGPVVVFGASNFPLAFSVAGGDTASALAAGCPVIVKAHSAHLGTSELVGGAIRDAVAEEGLPEGVFSLIFGDGSSVGQQLAAHSAVTAIAFTGSRRAGVALMDTAARRNEPIPVYAEMSSINPVLLLEGALGADPEGIANGFVASLVLGSGQFCTNPGLVFGVRGEALDRFTVAAASAIEASAPQTMLTAGICAAYASAVDVISQQRGVTTIARSAVDAPTSNAGPAALFSVAAADFLANPALHDEAFGAAATIVVFDTAADVAAAVSHLSGQLTATVHAHEVDDANEIRRLLPLLEKRVGRILFNDWPTGVEVGHAMVHGGPYPATSDGRSTSVGSLAIHRFLRPVAYQNIPDSFLPAALQDANPLGLQRRVDGVIQS